MPAPTPTQIRRSTGLMPTVLFGLLPAGLLTLVFGWPTAWPGALLALSASAFTLLWALWMLRRATFLRVSLPGIALWAVFVHLAIWLPFLFAIYLSGQGPGGIAFATFGTLVTGGAVGWYILESHIWETALAGLVLLGLIALLRRRRSGAK